MALVGSRSGASQQQLGQASRQEWPSNTARGRGLRQASKQTQHPAALFYTHTRLHQKDEGAVVEEVGAHCSSKGMEGRSTGEGRGRAAVGPPPALHQAAGRRSGSAVRTSTHRCCGHRRSSRSSAEGEEEKRSEKRGRQRSVGRGADCCIRPRAGPPKPLADPQAHTHLPACSHYLIPCIGCKKPLTVVLVHKRVVAGVACWEGEGAAGPCWLRSEGVQPASAAQPTPSAQHPVFRCQPATKRTKEGRDVAGPHTVQGGHLVDAEPGPLAHTALEHGQRDLQAQQVQQGQHSARSARSSGRSSRVSARQARRAAARCILRATAHRCHHRQHPPRGRPPRPAPTLTSGFGMRSCWSVASSSIRSTSRLKGLSSTCPGSGGIGRRERAARTDDEGRQQRPVKAQAHAASTQRAHHAGHRGVHLREEQRGNGAHAAAPQPDRGRGACGGSEGMLWRRRRCSRTGVPEGLACHSASSGVQQGAAASRGGRTSLPSPAHPPPAGRPPPLLSRLPRALPA